MVDDKFQFYGMFPYWGKKPCNIPEFNQKSIGTFTKGESYTITYDPIQLKLTIEGGRLTGKVERNLTKSKYFPVIFFNKKSAEIDI